MKVIRKTPVLLTTQERYAAAVRDVRAAGVTVRLNVQSSTMGSTTLDQLGVTDEHRDRHAWTWAGQGNRLVWRDGEPYRADKVRKLKPWHWQNADLVQRARFAQVYWYHGGPGVEAAQVLWAAFRGQRFDVDWDGTADKAVVVKLPAAS